MNKLESWFTSDEIYYVYALVDPRKANIFKYGEFEFSDGEPFYVGKGKEDRKFDHFLELRKMTCFSRKQMNELLNGKKIM